MATRLKNLLRTLWQGVRQLSGDDAYERYLAHHTAALPGVSPLPRGAWYAHHQQQKWAGIKRCC